MLLVGGVVVSTLFRAGGMWESGHPLGSTPFLHDLMTFVGMLLLGGGVLGCAAGWGLLDRQSWARTLSIVLACFALLLFIPFGTLLGIYTLWVLLPAQSEEEYRRISSAVEQST